MDIATIRHCTIADIENAPNIGDLMAEYAQESAISGLPAPCAQFDIYRRMEDLGVFKAFGAWHDGTLIGFMVMIVTENPHYGVPLAVSESLFVTPLLRFTGAGRKLIDAGIAIAADMGAYGILMSSPIGGRLAEVLPAIGFTETNRVFFKRLKV